MYSKAEEVLSGVLTMAAAVKCFWFSGWDWEARRVGERERSERSVKRPILSSNYTKYRVVMSSTGLDAW